MATVRFSKELTESIIAKANDQFKEELDKNTNNYGPDIGDRVYEWMVGDLLPDLRRLPMAWLKTTNEIYIRQISGTNSNGYFRFSAAQPIPVHAFNTPRYNMSNYDSVLLDDGSQFFEELRQLVNARETRRREIAAKRDTFVESVKKICDTYATLAPALKAWPPLWDLLPQEAKDRHMTVKERTVTERTVDGVDFESMTATVIANKIRGSIV